MYYDTRLLQAPQGTCCPCDALDAIACPQLLMRLVAAATDAEPSSLLPLLLPPLLLLLVWLVLASE